MSTTAQSFINKLPKLSTDWIPSDPLKLKQATKCLKSMFHYTLGTVAQFFLSIFPYNMIPLVIFINMVVATTDMLMTQLFVLGKPGERHQLNKFEDLRIKFICV